MSEDTTSLQKIEKISAIPPLEEEEFSKGNSPISTILSKDSLQLTPLGLTTLYENATVVELLSTNEEPSYDRAKPKQEVTLTEKLYKLLKTRQSLGKWV